MTATATEASKDERFRKYLDMQVKGFIDGAMSKANKPIPIPKTEFPLFYDNKELDRSVSRIKLGFDLFTSAYDLYVLRTCKES